MLTNFEVFAGTELQRRQRKGSAPRPYCRENYEKTKKRQLSVEKENKAASDIINQNKIQENKQKYKKLYDEFFKRGGAAWYESLTGLPFDVDRIYLDIDYFESVLELGCELESLERKPNVLRLKNRLDRDRLLTKYWEDLFNGRISRRQSMMGHACPGWADMDKIQQVYIERDRVTKETGIPHHVDHIVPICGDRVCGLHNEFNVRVITKTENLKKSNKFTIY